MSSISSGVIVLEWEMASRTSGPRACISPANSSYEGYKRVGDRMRWSHSQYPGGSPSRGCQTRSSRWYCSNVVSLTLFLSLLSVGGVRWMGNDDKGGAPRGEC